VKSTDQVKRDLVTAEVNRKLHALSDQYEGGNMGVGEKAARTADVMGEYVRNEVRQGASHTPRDHGATAAIGSAERVLKGLTGKEAGDRKENPEPPPTITTLP